MAAALESEGYKFLFTCNPTPATTYTKLKHSYNGNIMVIHSECNQIALKKNGKIIKVEEV